MKYCINCGTQLDDEAKFCFKCGASSAVTETPSEAADEIKAENPETCKASEDQAETIAADVNENAETEEATAKEPEENTANEPEENTVQTAIVAEAVPEHDQNPVYEGKVTKKTAYPAKTIVGFVLGIVGVVYGGLGTLFAFLSLLPYISVFCMCGAIGCGFIGLACSIVGIIFSSKIYKVEKDNKKAKIGKILSLIGIIAGGFGIVFGCIFGIIGISLLISDLYQTFGSDFGGFYFNY